jgi:phosphoribosylformylglycinamidine synthase
VHCRGAARVPYQAQARPSPRPASRKRGRKAHRGSRTRRRQGNSDEGAGRGAAEGGRARPAGKAIGNALAALGFAGVGEVRQGKLIELDLAETDPARARRQVEAMCKDLLANPVIEDYAIEVS